MCFPGANIGDFYTPDLTSYDYDAPMNEAGDPTSKYTAIHDVLLNVSYFSILTYMYKMQVGEFFFFF